MAGHPQARITVDGTTYTLQFTRDAVRNLERVNMAPTVDGRDGMPMQLATTMFHGALQLHHPEMNVTRATKLFDAAIDEGYPFEDLTKALFDLYNAVFKPPVLESGDGEKKTVEISGLETSL